MQRASCLWVLMSFSLACGEPSEPEPRGESPVEPAPRAGSESSDEDAEALPFCPEPSEPEDYDVEDAEAALRALAQMEDIIQLFVQLEHHRFILAGTDGTMHEERYEGEAYPRDAIRERLRQRRAMEPNRRTLFITNEPGIPASVAQAVLADARALGYDGAMRCRPATELDRLTADDYEPPAEAHQDPMEATGALMGDAPSSGYGRGAGLRSTPSHIAHVRLARPEVSGPVSVEVVRRVLRRHVDEIRFCYEQALDDDEALAGRMSVRFVIAPTGAVSDAEVTSSLDDEDLTACVGQAFRRWTFPAPEGGGTVTAVQSFELSSQ